MVERDITRDEAREILESPFYDAYGTTRMYGVIAKGEVSEGQIVGIKSTYYLDNYKYDRIYTKTNNGTVPIRKA